MDNLHEWPQEFKEKLIVQNKYNNIAITTLWTEKDKIAQHINNEYCLIANYYDVYNGFEPMIRNCLSNPHIRYIIIVGNDKSGSKNVLINFFNYGIQDGFIKNTDVPLPKDIPEDYILLVKQNIELIDLTNQINDDNDFEFIGSLIDKQINLINSKEYLEPYIEPIIFPKTEEVIDVFPSDPVYIVKGDFVGQVWLQVLNTVNSYGVKTKSILDESNEIRECINLISIINKENPDEPKMDDYFIFDKEYLFDYYKEFTTNYIPQGTSYTYGSKFHSNNQIDKMIEKIKQNKYTKRCYTTTWNTNDLDKENPPCVISFQVNIQNNKLYATSYIRSNDMFRAYPLNAFGLRKLQKIISEQVDIEMGTLMIISQSAHIYKENYNKMKEILNEYYTFTNCFYDPRGYYIIETIDNKIKVKHVSPQGKKLKEYEGLTAREINDQINSSQHTMDSYHASYLGEELMKAEICLLLNKNYVQDMNTNDIL